MKEVGIGLLGFGTVGTGLVDVLQANGGLIAERAGVRLVLKKIADIEITRDRGVTVDPAILTTDSCAVVNDPAVEVVVELIGGTGVAKDLILQSLLAKKPVVTANKALLAEYGSEILRVARENATDVCFEASVGGGIPIVRALTKGLVGNRIESIHGILNGTCNYILTRMSKEGLSFDRILNDAQEAGYAEADPALDIDGYDSAHKAAILASLAYGCHVPMSAIHVEGIRGLASEEIEYAEDLGYRMKLLATIKNHGGEINIHVRPTLIPEDHMLASVSGALNAILVRGDVVGETLYYGMGAGSRPTSSAVVSDIVDVARKIAFGIDDCAVPIVQLGDVDGRFCDAGKVRTRCYLRVSLLDRPGSMGRICSVLGSNGISMASVLQKEVCAGEHVPVIIVTHYATEEEFQHAVDEIDSMDIVRGRTVRLRIEDF